MEGNTDLIVCQEEDKKSSTLLVMPRSMSTLWSWKITCHDRKGVIGKENHSSRRRVQICFLELIWRTRNTPKRKCFVGWGFLFREKSTSKLEEIGESGNSLDLTPLTCLREGGHILVFPFLSAAVLMDPGEECVIVFSVGTESRA